MPDDIDPTSRLTGGDRPDVKLPDGRTLTPRVRLAKEIEVHPRTLARGNHATTYIAGVAYLDRDATLLDIASGLRRRCEPVKPRKPSARCA